jgi:hypothetical protein
MRTDYYAPLERLFAARDELVRSAFVPSTIFLSPAEMVAAAQFFAVVGFAPALFEEGA